MKLYPIFKKVTTVISGAINYRANVRPATRATLVATLRAALQLPATRASFAPATLRAALQRSATRVTARIVDGLVKPLQRPATRASLAPATLLAAKQRPAARITFSPAVLTAAKPRAAGNIVHVQWDLNHASHIRAGTAVNALGATKNWTNPANEEGAPNGTTANFDGDTLLLATAILDGNMVIQTARPDSLAILEVYLDFYGSVVGLPLVSDAISRLTLGYRVTGTGLRTNLESVTIGDSNFLSTPKSYRINRTGADAGKYTDGATAALSTTVDWGSLTNLICYWDAQTILGLVAAHYKADAVRLRVVAAETQLN